MDTWRKIGLQLKSNLESNWIWALRFLHSIIYLVQNKKLNGTNSAKLRIKLKSNWIFSKFWLLIYLFIYLFYVIELIFYLFFHGLTLVELWSDLKNMSYSTSKQIKIHQMLIREYNWHKNTSNAKINFTSWNFVFMLYYFLKWLVFINLKYQDRNTLRTFA